MARDLTQGNPLRQILLFSLPIFLGTLIQQFYSMADTVIVGRFLGEGAMAAVGSTGAVNFFILGFVQGTTTGFSVRTAQAFGTGDHRSVRRSVRCCMLLSAGLTVIMTALSVPFLHPLLRLMKTPDMLLKDAALYIRLICGGMFATVFYNMLASLLRALGDSRTPLFFLIVAAVFNILLDLLFIAVFRMGVEGAALATVIAQAAAAALCLLYGLKYCPYLHTKSEKGLITRDMLTNHISVGVPMGLQFSVTAIGSMMLQSAFNRFGAASVTAYTVAGKVESMSMQPGAALGATMATYAGQNLGAGRYDRIRRGIRCAIVVGVFVTLLGDFINIVLGEPLMRLFFAGEMTAEIRDLAMEYLRTVTLCFHFLTALLIFRNVLQGLGEKTVPMLGGVIELIARVSVCAVLPDLIGYTGACLAPCAAWIGAGLLTTVRYFCLERRWAKQGLMKGAKPLETHG